MWAFLPSTSPPPLTSKVDSPYVAGSSPRKAWMVTSWLKHQRQETCTGTVWKWQQWVWVSSALPPWSLDTGLPPPRSVWWRHLPVASHSHQHPSCTDVGDLPGEGGWIWIKHIISASVEIRMSCSPQPQATQLVSHSIPGIIVDFLDGNWHFVLLLVGNGQVHYYVDNILTGSRFVYAHFAPSYSWSLMNQRTYNLNFLEDFGAKLSLINRQL